MEWDGLLIQIVILEVFFNLSQYKGMQKNGVINIVIFIIFFKIFIFYYNNYLKIVRFNNK